MKMIVLAALLAAAGCSKKSGTDCESAIAKGVDSMLATVKSGSASPQMMDQIKEVAGKMQTALTQRCNEDKWSPEAVDCFKKLTSQAAMQACESKLNPEQRTKMRKDLIQVMTSMRPGAGPGHPPTLSGSAAPGAGNAAPPAAAPPPAGSTEPAAGATPPPAGSTPPATATPPAAPPAPSPPAAGSASGW